jgi:hypothetical protein
MNLLRRFLGRPDLVLEFFLTLSPVIGLDELLVRLGTTYIDPDVSSDKLF